MTVSVRPYRGQAGVWEVDIRLQQLDGTTMRLRRKAPPGTKRAALRWGREREREMLVPSLRPAPDTNPQPTRRSKPEPVETKNSTPTLEQFIPRYLGEYCRANRQKPSTIDAKESLIRLYLVPQLGALCLDEIGERHVQRLKGVLGAKSAKTVNNVLCVLNTILRCAKEWGVIDGELPRARWLKTASGPVAFYDFDAYERLVEAAAELDERTELVVLLGGEAGLRRGEMLALRWTDLDLRRQQVTVARSTWNGHTTQPKGGRMRIVPLTKRLGRVLGYAAKRAEDDTVLFANRGGPATARNITTWLHRAQARAGLETRKGAHTLRHTFCSHLAMRGAPPRAIQELAGHRHITTTERYMHLSPSALEGAIRLLEVSDKA